MEISSINVLYEALNSDVNFNSILIAENKKDKRIFKIIELCKKRKIPYKIVPSITIDKKTDNNNQGIYASISPIKFYKTEDLIKHSKKGLILILDKINDAGNLGAIIRTVAGADIDGIVIPKRNTAPINETVLKTSAGGLLKVKIALVANLRSEIDKLKDNGYWIAGMAMDGKTKYYNYDFKYKTAIILGNERNGISDILRKNSDYLLNIPHSKNIESLNVSVATSIVIFEALRQKSQK